MTDEDRDRIAEERRRVLEKIKSGEIKQNPNAPTIDQVIKGYNEGIDDTEGCTT